MRPLPTNLDELTTAMDQRERDINDWYLDTQTGEVILVSAEFVDEDADEEEDNDVLPEWQREAKEQARRVLDDTTNRYLQIPENEPGDDYRLMEEFIATVTDARASDLLHRAISGKGAFRRFKDTLDGFPAIREKWFEFENSRQRESAAEWLESIGLKSTWTPPAPH